MKYAKPHLPYDDQVRQLAKRGMDTGAEGDAVRSLRRIGYYRLSGYSYIFRDISPNGVLLDTFRPDTRLADVVSLHDFDSRLRHCLSGGLQALEVGFRVKVAYQLGKTSAFAHLNEADLDPIACSAPPRWPTDKATAYGSWRTEYDSLQRKSEREEYVSHFMAKYDGEVPIWAACEFMTMGCLVALYQLAGRGDRKRIADELDVKDPRVLDGWLRPLNVLRNHCAHNARIWNRTTTYPPDKVNVRIVGEEIHHLQSVDRNRVYFLAAVLAYLLRQIDPSTRWPSDFKTTMSKFPNIVGVNASSMGVQDGWRQQPLWRT